MHKYSPNIINEGLKILKENDNKLVLVRDMEDNIHYSIINKITHSFLIVDNSDIEDFLIENLKVNGVEIFATIKDVQDKYPRQSSKPLFWPKEKTWDE